MKFVFNNNFTKKFIIYFCLVLILSLGFFLRVYNIKYITNVDEPNIVKRAVLFADGKWHIVWYNWPAQSLIRIDGTIFAVAKLVLNFKNDSELSAQNLFNTRPELFYLLAHLNTVFFSLISIILVFLIGKKIRNDKAGLLAAFFLSISYLHGLHSKFATPDVPMTTAFLLCIFLSVCIYEEYEKKETKKISNLYLLAGLVFGFSLATKYTGALAIIPLFFVHFLIHFKKNGFSAKKAHKLITKEFIFFVLAAFVSHLFFNPFWIADFNKIFKALIFESGSKRIGVDWSGAKNIYWLNLKYYLKSLLAWNGYFISLIAYITAVYSFFKFKRKKWLPVIIISLFFLCILLGLSKLGLHWSRWAIPFCPLISILAAVGICDSFGHVYQKISFKKILIFAFAVFLSLISFPQLFVSFAMDYGKKTKGTTSTMINYIKTKIPAGSTIYYDAYHIKTGKEYKQKKLRIYLYNNTVQYYKEQGVDYLIVKPSRYSNAKKEPERYKNIITFFNDLKKYAKLTKSVSPGKNNILSHKSDIKFYKFILKDRFRNALNFYKGPTLSLYKIKK